MDEAAARRLVARESPGLSVQGCRFDKISVATENRGSDFNSKLRRKFSEYHG